MNKVYVLDTSVLIHDPDAPTKFQDNLVAIPIFVIMELDLLKQNKRYEVAAAARMTSRFISSLMDYGDLHDPEGVRHPDYESVFKVIANGGGQGLGALEEAESSSKMDLLIISAALSYQTQHPEDRVIIVSKDVNMRIVANAEGLEAQDYRTDKVDWRTHYTGYRTVECDHPLHDAYREDKVLHATDLGMVDLFENEFVMVPTGDRCQLFRYYGDSDELIAVPKDFGIRGIQPRDIKQRMALDLLTDPDIQLVTLVGKAGTGKTYLALAAALAQVSKEYDHILLSKPVVAMGTDIGYLPGDFETKMHPWMMSFFDNLDQLIPGRRRVEQNGKVSEDRNWDYLFETRMMEIQAIHSIRGRSISNAFMIIDEAQNLSPHELKTIITRAAKGTKIVLCGDPHQIDSRFMDKNSNGLVYVTDRVKETPISGTVTFTEGQRSPLAEVAASLL